MLNIGCHLSTTKGFKNMGKEALQINANTFQFFTRNPRGGKAKDIDEKDIEALRVIIDKDVSYIGMIGSKQKWRTLKSELLSEGVDENLLNSVYSPVGLNISSNDIDEIAFGIMAEILLVKNKGELSHRKDKK